MKIKKITIKFMSNEVKAYGTVTRKQMLAVQDVRHMDLSMLIHSPFKRVNHKYVFVFAIGHGCDFAKSKFTKVELFPL